MKLGTWGEPTVWPTETLSGRSFRFPNDWPAHTRTLSNGQFVILDFGLTASDFDIDAAIADLMPKPKKAARVESEEPETPDA